MLFRRVAEHVRTQNWTAIAIDFVIVVTGVFMGVQAANWNADRVERQREELVLDRLAIDFSRLLESGAFRVASGNRTMDDLDTIIGAIDRGELIEADRPAFERGLKAPSDQSVLPGRSSTFVEVTSSGNSQLIRDEELRSMISRFHDQVDFSQSTFSSASMAANPYLEVFARHRTLSATRGVAGPAQYGTENRQRTASLAAYDFSAMKADPEFRRAAQELREVQASILMWHQANHDLGQAICARLKEFSGRECALPGGE